MSRLIVGEQQAIIIGKSLTAYASILQGKVTAITSVLSENGRRTDFGTEAELAMLLKRTCFTELPHGAFYDIEDPKTPALAKIAYDMGQLISTTIAHEKSETESKYKLPSAISGLPFPEFTPVLNRDHRRYRLTVEETQFNIIINALLLYEMILCGNLNFICEILEMTGRRFDKEQAKCALNAVKTEMFPELSLNRRHMIENVRVPAGAKMAEHMRIQLSNQCAA